MKTYIAHLTIREKGTNKVIRMRAGKLSESASDELRDLFVWEILNDPNRVAKAEFGESLGLAKAQLEADYEKSKESK